MNKNLDLIAKELYAKLSRYSNLVMKDSEGNDIDSDQSEGARKFNFEYEVNGENLANITISLNDQDDDQDAFEVLISNDPVTSGDEYAKKMFLKFGRELREFAKRHLMTFNIHIATRSNKERDPGESIMRESKLFGTAKTSYQRIGEATLVIKHRDVVNQENPAGRTQRIDSIYVENSQGERFKYPYRHLNGARAMAQHVAHGGNPYDGIGQYMTGLSEELTRLRMFKSYVERNEMVSEAMGSINSKVLERIEQVKREIQQLQRPTHYAEFSESFIEPESVEIPEDVMSDWIDRLTIRTFNEELKNVFPYIFKLVNEDDIPVKELGVEDFVLESGPEDDEEEPDSIIIPELASYEQYLTMLSESESEGIFAAENEDAIAELNQLLQNPLPLGVDGTNIISSLEGLGFDTDFLNGLKKMADSETGKTMDSRPFIKEYIQQKDAELGTDVLGQLVFGDDNEIAADNPEPIEPAPAADVAPDVGEPPADEPVAEVPPEELPMPPAPVAEAMMKNRNQQMFNELKEFISSMYNSDQGNFPKGVEGVKIACEKKFGDRVGPMAAKIVERMTAMGEMRRIKELSGMSEGSQYQKKKGSGRLTGSDKQPSWDERNASVSAQISKSKDDIEKAKRAKEAEKIGKKSDISEQANLRKDKSSTEIKEGYREYDELRDRIDRILIKAYNKYGTRDAVINAAKPVARRVAQELGVEKYFDEVWMNALAGHDVNTDFGDNGDNFDYTDYSMRNGERGIGEMTRMKELSGLSEDLASVAEGLDPESRDRLNDLIDQFRNAVDPSVDDYDNEYSDPDDTINQIRQEFGDKIAAQVESGALKMHFPRDNHTTGYDPLSWKKPIDRQTKAGKMYKQDSDYRKNTINSRYRLRGKSSTEGVEARAKTLQKEDSELTAMLRIAGLR